jgi:large subunit ribosomal protein L22
MAQLYSYEKYDADRMARAKSVGAEISTKHSVEIASAIRGKPLDRAITLMKSVSEKKTPIRFTRFNSESAAHKPGIGPGKYPVKASLAYLKLLESVKKNAAAKNMDEEKLRIIHVKADRGAAPYHYGRHRGRTMKRTHLEIIVIEDEKVARKKEAKKKVPKKAAATKKKPEAKKEEKKQSPKSEAKSESKPQTAEEKQE